MNLRKLKLTELKEIAIKYNSIIGEYSPATILNMTRQELVTVIHEWTRLTDSQIEYYIYKDIKGYLYRLEGKNINISYKVTKINDTSPSSFIFPIQETVKESYVVKDFMIQEKYKGYNKLDNKVEELWQIRDFTTFKGEKLTSFYKEVMKMVNEETIFSKLKGIEI